MTLPIPNSAKESIVRTLEKRPLTPKYSVVKNFKKILLEIKPRNKVNIRVNNALPAFIVDFFVLDSAMGFCHLLINNLK